MKQINWKQFGVIIALLLGVILAFSPVDQKSLSSTNAMNLIKEISERKDCIQPEQLGEMIIDQDPSLLLVDIRSEEEFEKFHIKSALNIPFQGLFSEAGLSELNENKLIVLYSNGDNHAAQAWILLRESGFDNVYVLVGGLNYWVDVYTNPAAPKDIQKDSELFRYQYLVSAGAFLMGNVQARPVATQEANPVKIDPVKRPKTKKRAEGC